MSYARADREIARPLYKRLTDSGLDVWVDFDRLLPGHKWNYEIKKAIVQANLFLVLLTKNSVDRRGYIQKEFRLALDFQEQLLDGDIFIIPVLLEACEVPDQFSEYNSVELCGEEDFHTLLNAIESIESIQVQEELRSTGLEDNFFVEVSESFETKNPSIPIKIKVVTALRIDDIGSIRPLMNEKQGLKGAVAQYISHILQQYFHDADPERCYMRFTHSQEDAEASIEEDLVKLVTDGIAGHLGLTVVGVVIKPMETALSVKFRRLIANPIKFDLPISTSLTGKKVSLEGEFVVDSLDTNGWHLFSARDFDTDDLKACAVDYLSSLLRSFPTVFARPESDGQPESIFLEVQDRLLAYIVSVFGLHIKVTYLHRSRAELGQTEDTLGEHLPTSLLGHDKKVSDES